MLKSTVENLLDSSFEDKMKAYSAKEIEGEDRLGKWRSRRQYILAIEDPGEYYKASIRVLNRLFLKYINERVEGNSTKHCITVTVIEPYQ